MSKKLTVQVESNTGYDILIERDFGALGNTLKQLKFDGRKACIITDSNVGALYADEVKKELETVCSSVSVYTFTAGEEHKNLTTIHGIYEHLLKSNIERNDFLVALGGGVTGDMTGFAASTYLRGIPYIQIPTTLLAQVDSSIGGKTGVDFEQYKNMIGAFYQPSLVYMNLTTLSTLPKSEFSSGMGEILKHGLIKDEDYYVWIISNMFEIDDREYEILEEMIFCSCEIKKAVVEKDPKEKGDRALLNFGHTIGHAIEKLKDFQLSHGHCVSLGIVAASYISHKRELLSAEELFEIRDMNVGFSLPITFAGLNPEDILQATKLDKKMEQGNIRFILLSGIGNAVIAHDVTDEEILEAINFINGDRIDYE